MKLRGRIAELGGRDQRRAPQRLGCRTRLGTPGRPHTGVEQPDGDQRWDYRRAAVERIQDAVRNLLMARAGVIPGRIAKPRLSLAAATGSR